MVTRKVTFADGELDMAMTSKNHVSITGRVKVRGREYKVHVHLHLLPGGSSWESRYVDQMGVIHEVDDQVTKADKRETDARATSSVAGAAGVMVRAEWSKFVETDEATRALVLAEAQERAVRLEKARVELAAARRDMENAEDAERKARDAFVEAMEGGLITVEEKQELAARAYGREE